MTRKKSRRAGAARKRGGSGSRSYGKRYDLYRSAEGPVAFLLYEIWESREHHAAHTKTDHFLRWNARKDSLLTVREAGNWTQIA